MNIPTKVPRISLARLPTPLQLMERLSKELNGPRIWIKRDDLTESAAAGNKLRKLEFSIAQAIEQKSTVLITAGGIQSNHCRATAIMAAKLGLKCHLILRGHKPDPASGDYADGNLLLDNLTGAAISFVSGKEFDDIDATAEKISADYRTKGDITFFIPTGASDEIGLWGYIECARELKEDFARYKIKPGYVISAAGSGGTMAGLVLGNYLYDLNSNIMAYNVARDADWFEQKIRSDISKWQQRYDKSGAPALDLDINIIDGYVGPGYAQADQHVYDTISRLARTEGMFFDPVYTGKAFDAMLQEYAQGRFNDAEDIVFIHTGGIYGLFPQRAKFNATPET
ncbi:MAG: D-cysteine desulfhydrase family protein [Pseudomonadales bacterium]|jgi:D-cysteine desulfhydrase